MEQAPLRSQQELQYKAFYDMVHGEPFAMLREHMREQQEKYRKDIVHFLRSKEDDELIAKKCRLAQQAIDIIENTLFGVHINEIMEKLNPNKKTDEKLSAQGGQIY